MAEPKLRYSKQRETIYQVLKEDSSHPTVDKIYMNVKQIIPDISLGTVYRNLNLLADQKRILRLDVGDGVVHFDAKIEPHYHFICNDCGDIQDIVLEDSVVSPLLEKVREICEENIESAEIIFHGSCRQCHKKKI